MWREAARGLRRCCRRASISGTRFLYSIFLVVASLCAEGGSRRLRDWSVCHHCPSVPCVLCQAPPGHHHQHLPPTCRAGGLLPTPTPSQRPPPPGRESLQGQSGRFLSPWQEELSGPQCHPPSGSQGPAVQLGLQSGGPANQRPRVSPGPSLNPPAPLPGARARVPTLAADEDSVLRGWSGLSIRLLPAFRSKSLSPGTTQQYSGAGGGADPPCLLPPWCIVTTLPTAFVSSPAGRHPCGWPTRGRRGPWRHVCLAQNLSPKARDGGCTWARGVGAGVIGKLFCWHPFQLAQAPRGFSCLPECVHRALGQEQPQVRPRDGLCPEFLKHQLPTHP